MAYQSKTFTKAYIIPMDATAQTTLAATQNNGMYRAYGLIYKLLYDKIIHTSNPLVPIYWAISPSKQIFADLDFTASIKQYQPVISSPSVVNYNYTGGPFIIDISDPTVKGIVDGIIVSWNTVTPKVTVHEFVITNDFPTGFTAPYAAKLLRPPKVCIEFVNNGIVIPYLEEAGIPDYYEVYPFSYGNSPTWSSDSPSVFSSAEIGAGAFYGNTAQLTCRRIAYDIFITPHTDEKTWLVTNTMAQLDQFLRYGGLLHSMCHSIPSIENIGFFLTSSGITEDNKGTTFEINQLLAENPLLQAVSTTQTQKLPGGSVQTWPHASTVYFPATNVFADFASGTVKHDFMVGGPYKNGAGAGAIVYEGGHSYSTNVPYTGNNETLYYKFVLNDIFMAVTKPYIDVSVSPNPVKTGVANTLFFTVKNTGGGQATNVNLTLDLSTLVGISSITYVSGAVPNISGTTVTWSNETMDAGEEFVVQANYTHNGSGEVQIFYNATFNDDFFATSAQTPYHIAQCTALIVIPANQPFLVVNKLVNGSKGSSSVEGQPVTYSFKITNVGDQPAINVIINDPPIGLLPAPLPLSTYFNLTPANYLNTILINPPLPTLPAPYNVPGILPGEANAVTVTITATPKNNVQLPSLITNIANVSYTNTTGQNSFTSANSSANLTILTPDIDTKKSVDMTSAVVGDILTYTAIITNTGNVPMDKVLFTDLIPPDTIFQTGTTIVETNYTTTNIIVTEPSPSTLKVEVDGLFNPVSPGELPPYIKITFQVKINSNNPNPVTNIADVFYTYTIGNTTTTKDKNSNPVSTNIAGLIITKTGPQNAKVGDEITYTIGLTNNGKVDLSDVVVTDLLPAHTSLVSVSATGANIINQAGNIILKLDLVKVNIPVTITLKVKVDTLPPDPYQITNNASATFILNDEPTTVPGQDVVTNIVQAGISVLKGTVGDITTAKVGDTITYKVDIKNTGNVPVNLTKFNDTIPISQIGSTSYQGEFKLGTSSIATPLWPNVNLGGVELLPPDTITITFKMKIESLPPLKILDDVATVFFTYKVGNVTQPETSAKDDYSLNVEEIKVSVTKDVTPKFAEPGDILTYSFVIKNDSSVAITDVRLFDPLPPHTTFNTTSFLPNPGENPTSVAGALVANTLAANSQVHASFTVTVDPTLTSAVTIPDSATVKYNYKLGTKQEIGIPVNSEVVNTKVEIPKIIITKQVSDQYAEVGSTIKYTLIVKNTGSINAYDVNVIDDLDTSLKYVPGTLVVVPQVAGDGYSAPDPSNIVIDLIRPTSDVVKITFDANVLSRPDSGIINDTAHANFVYTLDPDLPPTTPSGDIPSNTVSTTIQVINVKMTKEADNTFVEVGQHITYVVTVSNQSTVSVDNAFTDTLPTGTQYITGSFKKITGTALVVNNTLPNASAIDVKITGMLPNSTVVFSYDVEVLVLPTTSEVTNSAKVVPTYKLFPNDPITHTGDPVTDSVTTPVIFVKLDVIKTVQETVATIGDTLHYAVKLMNNGNVPALNVFFTDNVPAGTEYVADSLTVDGIAKEAHLSGGNISTAIGTILAGHYVTVKFEVKVKSIPNPPKAINIATVLFDVEINGKPDPRGPVNSPPVETPLKLAKLEAVKTVDKDAANVGDTLTYTVVITNTGDVTIDNVIFSDVIPEGTVLLGNQPIVNVNLGSIEPGKSKTVTFQVKIVSKPCPPKLINIATVSGTYFIGTTRKLVIMSNEAVTYLDVKMFRQISVDENLKIPPQKPDMEEILEAIVEVEITYTNVIKTPIVTSYEGQTLSGWKLIVEGKLKQKIVYIADVSTPTKPNTQPVHAAEFDVPFSTYIVLQGDYKNCMRFNVVGKIEDVFVEMVDKRTIFKNVTLMLEAVANNC